MKFGYLLLVNLVILFGFLKNESFAKVVNVKHYGAVGNGVNNDSKKFNNAISILNNRDTLFIPAGMYLLDNLNIKDVSNLTILGPGSLIASKNALSYFLVIRKCPFIVIQGITINGNNNINLAIDLVDSPNGTIKNVQINDVYGKKHNWSAGIILRKNNSNFSVKNTNITNIHSQQSAAMGIFIVSLDNETYSRNISITNSKIVNINSPIDADAIKIQQIGKSSALEVKNCFFKNNQKRAVKIQTNNVKLLNNTIERTEEYKNGFSVFSLYGSNIEVINNEFRSYGDASVNMFVDVSAVENILISGNLHINSLESTTNVRDFILTKYHSNENTYLTNNVIIENNRVINIRHFLRLGSNVDFLKVKNNNVDKLQSNFIFIIEDKHVDTVYMRSIGNSIKYKQFIYKELWTPKKVKLSLY